MQDILPNLHQPTTLPVSEFFDPPTDMGTGLAPVGSWVFLSYNTPMVLPPPYIPSSDASSPAVDGPETSDQADLDADLEEDALDRSVDSLIRLETGRM